LSLYAVFIWLSLGAFARVINWEPVVGSDWLVDMALFRNAVPVIVAYAFYGSSPEFVGEK